MRKVNTNDLPGEPWRSPGGKFSSVDQNISIALGRDPASTDLLKRHPFDVEICRVLPGTAMCPYHSHSAQWEFYYVVSGQGSVRHETGTDPVVPGDAFLFEPGQAHQLINDGAEDLILYIVADNPIGESSFYPDSGKWLLRSPERRLIRSGPLDYFDGEE